MISSIFGSSRGVEAVSIYSVSFSPDGTTLVSSGNDAGHLWDVGTGELRHTLIGHTGGVSFSPDGTTLASGSYDGTVRLWNVSTGELLRTLEEPTWEAVGETIVLEKYSIR